MSALSSVAAGLVLVAIDFRTEALDLLPDPLGWVLVAVGAWRLTIKLASLTAAAAAVLSLADVWLNFRHVPIDPSTLEILDECPPAAICPEVLRYDLVGPVPALLIALATVTGAGTIGLILHRLATIDVVSPGAAAIARTARLLRVAAPVAWMVPFIAVVVADTAADRRYQPFWDGGLAFVSPVLMLILLGVAAFLVYASSRLGRLLDPPHGPSGAPVHRGPTDPPSPR